MINNKLKIFIFFLLGAGIISSCSEDNSSLIDGMPDAVVNNDPSNSPPRILDESWNLHSETLWRQYFDPFVSVYYDNSIERPLEWPFEFTSNVWEYTTGRYGNFGASNLLYAVFYGEGGSSSSYQTIFDQNETSLITVALEGREMNSSNMDKILREISKIVENSAKSVSGSPASALWGDQWREIFTYDVYRGLGMEEDAQRVYDAYMQTTSNTPSQGVNWFKDWYYPIYQDHGRFALINFFDLVSRNFPIENNTYTRNMTLGELVHFYSGATGEDLQFLAEEAFGWSNENETELLQARADYPALDYPFPPVVVFTDLTLDAQVSVKYDNPGGPQANEGSLKVIDNDTGTKFLFFNYTNPSDMWIQQELPEAEVVNRYSLTSANDAPDRDPKSWTIQGSNDGETWVVLDSRTNETFSSRRQTRDFTVDNQEAYQYYRIYVSENGGSTLFQLAEWRLVKRTSLLD